MCERRITQTIDVAAQRMIRSPSLFQINWRMAGFGGRVWSGSGPGERQQLRMPVETELRNGKKQRQLQLRFELAGLANRVIDEQFDEEGDANASQQKSDKCAGHEFQPLRNVRRG